MTRKGMAFGAFALLLTVGSGSVPHTSRSKSAQTTIAHAGIVYSDAALTYHVTAEYSTATAVIPRMYGSASPDTTPGRYRYTYTLVNDAASTNTIWAFALDPATNPISITPPSHWQWIFGYMSEDSALYFKSEPDTNPAPVGWDSLTVVRSVYDLAAGDSLTFSFVSDRAPSMTMFYVQGYYQDSTASETEAIRYWPVSIWNNSVTGTVIGPGTVAAAPERPPGTVSAPQLRVPQPNPSSSSASVAFYLPRPGRVVLGVYDVSGRLVTTLASRPYPQGLHSASWNGLTSSGEKASTGVYFFRLSVDGSPIGAQKMIMVR